MAPILPARNFDETVGFYAAFGFDAIRREDAYLILRRDNIELHFFAWRELDASKSYAGCYIRVADVDAYARSFDLTSLPREGIPRLIPLETKPWGMREFALIDPNGSLIRIGSVAR